MSRLVVRGVDFKLFRTVDGSGLVELGPVFYYVNTTVMPSLVDDKVVEAWIKEHKLRPAYAIAYQRSERLKKVVKEKKRLAAIHTSKNNKYLVRREAEYKAIGYPDDVAAAQASWDLNCLFYWGFCHNATLERMAKRFNRTREVIRQRVNKYHRQNFGLKLRLSPIEKWQEEREDFEGWTNE